MFSGQAWYIVRMDRVEKRLWTAILGGALPPALGVIWITERVSPSTPSPASVLLAVLVSYGAGLLVSFLVVGLGLLAFNLCADLWWTLREDHRSSRAPDDGLHPSDCQAVTGPELRDRYPLDFP